MKKNTSRGGWAKITITIFLKSSTAACRMGGHTQLLSEMAPSTVTIRRRTSVGFYDTQWTGKEEPTMLKEAESCERVSSQNGEPSAAHKRLLGNGGLRQGLGEDEGNHKGATRAGNEPDGADKRGHDSADGWGGRGSAWRYGGEVRRCG